MLYFHWCDSPHVKLNVYNEREKTKEAVVSFPRTRKTCLRRAANRNNEAVTTITGKPLVNKSVNKEQSKRIYKQKMTDKQDTYDMRLVVQKFEAISTTEPNLNLNEQSVSDHHHTMPKVKNSPSTNSIKERKKKGIASEELKALSINLPGNNVPERILFVIDTVRKLECTPFESIQGDFFNPLQIIKRAIEIFVKAKVRIQSKHEFALMTLNTEGVTWICDFTNNCPRLLDRLNAIDEDLVVEEENAYDLGSCFQKIYEKVDIDDNHCFPNYIVRTVLIYSRSMMIPHVISNTHSFESVMKHKNFFFDILYVHEPQSETNNCEDVFKELCNLVLNKSCYILEVGRNLTILHTNMARLLAHPLQRAKDPTHQKCYNQQEFRTNV